MVLAFDDGEYIERIRRLKEAMVRARLDVLLVFHQEHMYYLTGYDKIGAWAYQVLIVPADDSDFTVIVTPVDEFLARRTAFIPDVRVWMDDVNQSPVDFTMEVLRSRKLLDGKRIGIESKSYALLPYYHAQLLSLLSDQDVVDASDLIMELRLVKSPAEIDCMRRAGVIMDRSVRKALEMLRPGIRECEIHGEVSRVLVGDTAGAPAVPPPISSGPNLISQTSSEATERRIEPGDPFMIELGAQYRRYHAVCIRMASLGSPIERLREMHDAIVEGTGLALEQIRPGVPTADVARAVHLGFEKRGFSRRRRQVGYGIGIGYAPTWVEGMMLRETDPHILEPGMTFLLQGVLLDREARLGAAFGDPILVTQTGHERLTSLPREMTVK